MSILGRLEPETVWGYFEEICRIPRLSGNEAGIRKYLIDFAKAKGLEAHEDKIGNILIVKPAAAGMENRKTVILQSHMDMVGEKNADHPHDWEHDPIIPVIKGDWVTATGTTLGADDGIGIASQLAILADRDLKAGRIECLFTVDEESGMTGAINLEPDFLTGRTLLNLDSEDEGILFIGCAGGMDTVGTMSYDPVKVSNGSAALEISVTGLHGGHSGDEIHKGYGNSVKLMAGILTTLQDNYNAAISNFDGGNLRNAIPREAFATVVFDELKSKDVLSAIDKLKESISVEFAETEKELRIATRKTELPSHVMDKVNQEKFLTALISIPHGALAWSKEMEDLVETSTNLASARFEAGSSIKIVTTQRSSIDASKRIVAQQVAACMEQAGAVVEQSNGYPGWKPDLSSEILRMTRNSYKKLFGREPLVRAIHAGLECGLVYEKVPGIDMISFGPTIRGAHTPEEMIEIRTTMMFWDLLLDLVTNMPVAS
jgi:dipeptidase D